MSKTIKLPSGATVEWRDADSLKQKDRAKVVAAGENGENAAVQAMSMAATVIAVMVESWSFDLIPPNVKIESLGELSIPDYDALMELADKAMGAMFPALTKTVESELDPKVITENSNG